MSKYNHYAKQLEAAYKKARAEYLELYGKKLATDKALEKASVFNSELDAADNEYNLSMARVEAEHATNALLSKRLAVWDNFRIERDKLTSELEKLFKLNPADVDLKCLSLLDNNVLKAEDYNTLLELYSDNITMLRMLSIHAAAAYQNCESASDRAIYLKAMENKESALLDNWRELTSGIELFTVSRETPRNDDVIARTCKRFEEIFGKAIEEF